MNSKFGVLCAFLLVASAPAFAQSPGSRADIQKSLGFEDQTNSTLTGWWSNPPQSVSLDSQIVHGGHWSVRLRRDAKSSGTFSALTRMIPVDFQGKGIELRGYLRLQNVSDFAGFWLREDDADGQVLQFDNMQQQQLKGTREWTNYSIVLPIHPKAEKLYFGALIGGTGTLWVDDIDLLVDGKPIADAPAAAPRGPMLPADHEFDSGSRVAQTSLTPVQIANLAKLARVWGFLKYHHPAVTAGHHHWDYDLFRIMPAILAAPDSAHANKELVAWIKRLGPVPPCKPCVAAPSGGLDLKPAIDWINDRKLLGASLSKRLQSIYENRTGKQFFVSPLPGVGNPSFDHELAYQQVKFPDAGYQLLALFRWWNIMAYWSPYRDTAGQDWSAVLSDFIPKLALAKDKDAYQLALFELIAKANDTHANLWSSISVRPPVGDCAIPVELRFVGDNAVVNRAGTKNAALQAGDVIEKLDGASISSLVEKWTPFYADSNDAARKRDMAMYLTRGKCGPVSVGIMRNGQSQHVLASRTAFTPNMITHDRPGDTFQMLSPDIAYIKLSSIKASDLPAYFDKAKSTKGLIIDIRNYPSEFMPFAMGAYLASKPTQFVNFTFADLENPGAFHFGNAPKEGVPTIAPGPVHYAGKVVVLVDECSQSQAEYTAMAFRAMPNALVVGGTTAGADGNVSAIPLPGGLSTMISGLGVYYPDHRPTQRVGIIPDIVAKPTIQGIAAGRDEVLETAMHVIDTQK